MYAHQCCILAAGYHSSSRDLCSLRSFSNERSILDWQIHAFKYSLPSSKVCMTIGYEFEKIRDRYPQLSLSHILDWESGTALQSFLQARLDLSNPVIAMYGDTLFHSEIIKEFSQIEGDIVVAIDSKWKNRFQGRTPEDIQKAETLKFDKFGVVEYTGLIKFSVKAMEWIFHQQVSNFNEMNFVDLIDELSKAGFDVVPFDVLGQWAEMNEANDLVQFILGNKAETLRRIQPQLTKSKICDQFVCVWGEWSINPESVAKDIAAKFNGKKLIVRSSSAEEDSWETANAGKFESVLDVDSNDLPAVSKSIQKVFKSYNSLLPEAQVLIQPFISDVLMSGVIFTCDLVTGAPYYVVNYDDVTGRTDSVTSGQVNNLRTVIFLHDQIDTIKQIDPRLEPLV